ncbi:MULTISPECIES: ParM/StbA family protein [Ramlibacter]|uniref:ParM/StbA family protein n=1 Tax=Ramlibacter aquaticus TaxID=2780094 RepID=A0ABR9SDI5_9BURK|nr:MULTISPECIES: ParM/StbA family protein [Ramlibacter]MBE7940117.1 ParM/StbA family protein [Ramlibacter aquaticus]
MNHRINAAAIDLGYNIVKVAYPTAAGPGTTVFPATAALLTRGPESVRGLQGLTVEVDRRRFFVGQDAQRCLGGTFSKPAQGDYLNSSQYRALMVGALSSVARGGGAKAGDNLQVACLALGLPVATFRTQCEQMARTWTGVFDVPLDDGTVRIHIEQVSVLPQPLGALARHIANVSGLMMEDEQRELIDEINASNILVLDAGSGALNFLAMRGSWYVDWQRSGSAPHGMAQCARSLARSFGDTAVNSWLLNPCVMHRLDWTIARREPFKMAQIGTVSCQEYWPSMRRVIDHGLDGVAHKVQHFRDCDRVLVTGGGARFYAQRLLERFPTISCTVEVVIDPILSNVFGFYAKADATAVHAALEQGARVACNEAKPSNRLCLSRVRTASEAHLFQSELSPRRH